MWVKPGRLWEVVLWAWGLGLTRGAAWPGDAGRHFWDHSGNSGSPCPLLGSLMALLTGSGPPPVSLSREFWKEEGEEEATSQSLLLSKALPGLLAPGPFAGKDAWEVLLLFLVGLVHHGEALGLLGQPSHERASLSVHAGTLS